MKSIRFALGAALMSLAAILAAPMAHATQTLDPLDEVILCIEAPEGFWVIVFVNSVPVREFYSETCPIL
jgi:hypothetical protein